MREPWDHERRCFTTGALLQPLRRIGAPFKCHHRVIRVRFTLAITMTPEHRDWTPLTLGKMSALGVRRLLVSCRDNSCRRETLLDVSRYPAGTEIPAFARRLACDSCGSDVEVRPYWQDIR
jgi:hypothetical protein